MEYIINIGVYLLLIIVLYILIGVIFKNKRGLKVLIVVIFKNK